MTLNKTLAVALVVLAAGGSIAEAKDAKAKPAAPAKTPAKAESSAAPQQAKIDTQKDWNAFAYTDGGSTVCYANSRPKKSEPAAKRDPIYFFITNRPAQNVKGEISIAMGYPLKPNADVTLEIGTAKFALFGKDDFAWVRNPADQPRIIAALKGGRDMVVKGTSKRGTQTTDTYSLAGLSAVLNTIDNKCK